VARREDFLRLDNYRNYRNVRAVAIVFVLLGGFLAIGGLALAFDDDPKTREEIPPAIAIVGAIIGLSGAVGGTAVIWGNRRWARLVYGLPLILLLGFPIGTILGYVMLSGLSQYLTDAERIMGKST
jgi:hypothetical protein